MALGIMIYAAFLDMPWLCFDNIFLTPTGLRLIDVGIFALKEQVGERLFARFVKQELQEFEQLWLYFGSLNF